MTMKTLIRTVRIFLREQDGPTVTEYGVMLVLVIVVCIATITLIGNKVQAMFTSLTSGLPGT